MFENCKRGPFGLFENPVCSKISEKMKVGPFEGKKKFEKNSRTVPKKIERGDPSVLSAFANARKSFWLKLGLKPLGSP